MSRRLVLATLTCCCAAVAGAQPTSGPTERLPASVCSYASYHQLWPRLQALWQSNAVQNLWASPGAQMGYMAALSQPQAQQVLTILRQHPLAVQLTPVLADLTSDTIFITADDAWPTWLRSLQELHAQVQLGMDFDDPSATQRQLIDTLQANPAYFRLPALLFGGRLADPAAAEDLLATWLPQLPGVEPMAADAGGGYRFRLDQRLLPPMWLDQLASSGLDEAAQQQVRALVDQVQVDLLIGVRDDHLLLHIGSTPTLWEAWSASDESLAASAAFEPLRQRGEGELLSLFYQRADLRSFMYDWPGELRRFAASMGPMLQAAQPDLDEAEIAELRAGTIDFADALQACLPRIGSELAWSSRRDDGIAFWSVSGDESFSRSDVPLTILRHRGPEPVFARAQHQRDCAIDYAAVSALLRQGWQLVQRGLQLRPTGMEAQTEAICQALAASGSELDNIMQQQVVPALGAFQSVEVVDLQGAVAPPPGTLPVAGPVAVPRLGLVVELADAAAFTAGAQGIWQEFDSLLERLRTIAPGQLPPELRLPMVIEEPVDGGKRWSIPLPLPPDLGTDVALCAVIADGKLFCSTSERQIADLRQVQTMPSDEVVGVQQAAAGVTLMRNDLVWLWLQGLARSGIDAYERIEQAQQQAGGGSPFGPGMNLTPLIRLHVGKLLQSLGAIRGYRSRSWIEGDRLIQHGWLHVKDIDR